MTIHKEGYLTIAITLLLIAVIQLLVFKFIPGFVPYCTIILLLLLVIILQFFRHPKRNIAKEDNNLVYAPADGKVVVIEKTQESEYFKAEKLQISIFMSPLNVHVNRNPFGGVVKYFKYHPGKYLVAWHPKSSTENERTTVVLDNGKFEILLRQIAGMMERRIVNYLSVGQKVSQGSEMGFIKFGSRVDIFLPLNAKVKVEIGDKVRANKSIVAELS